MMLFTLLIYSIFLSSVMFSFVSGDDKTLRFYNVHTRQAICTVPLGIIARSVDYSPDGRMLVVGFGGRVGRGKEKGGGVVRLYSADPHAAKGIVKVNYKNSSSVCRIKISSFYLKTYFIKISAGREV